MSISSKSLRWLVVLVASLTGCTDYEPKTIEWNTTIAQMTLINVELKDDVHLIPNQQVPLKLSVPELNGKKVSGVYMTGIAEIGLNQISRAEFRPEFIVFESDYGIEKRPLKGFVVDADGRAGIHIKCNNSDGKNCGYYIIERNKVYWKLATQKSIDIGGITIMIEEA